MRIRLVKVYNKAGDVFLAPFISDKTVHIQCPFFNVGAAFDMGIVGIFIEIDRLFPESQLVHPRT